MLRDYSQGVVLWIYLLASTVKLCGLIYGLKLIFDAIICSLPKSTEKPH